MIVECLPLLVEGFFHMIEPLGEEGSSIKLLEDERNCKAYLGL